MKTRLALIGTILAVASLSVPFIISETSPKPEIADLQKIEFIDKFVEYGCTEPALNHAFRYSSLLDDSFDGTYYIDAIGYPEDLSQEEFDNCVKIILEERISNISSFGPATNSINKWGGAPMYQKQNKSVEELLSENNIDYLQDKLVVTRGPTTGGDPGCGAVIDTDLQTHWFEIDSVSNPKDMTLYSENLHPCKPNETSCFCNAQMKLTALTLDELSYFTLEEEEKFAHILIDYLKNNNVNVTPKFQIGKLNLNFTDPDAVGYCGELWGDNRNDFFSGAIVNGYVKDYGLDKELPLLCAISENAKWWENEN